MRISDCTVCYWLTDWCDKAKIDPEKVYFNTDHDKHIINIYTPVPGSLIGPKGIYINYAEVELGIICTQRKCKNYKINLVEVTKSNFWVNYNPVLEDF